VTGNSCLQWVNQEKYSLICGEISTHMSNTTVIRVENLSKKYIIGHLRAEGYQTLRDSMAGALKNAGRRLLHPFRASAGQPLLGMPGTEEFWALKDVSFEVEKGDRIGIIGRNGAGKTTLLKLLSRITYPTEGRISIKGRVASLLEVGTGFHPELTGRENIFLNGAVLGMGRGEIKERFDEIVEFAEVQKFIDTPVKRYSSGMYVRLAFSVAAHLEPEILLVDEVLAVGDAQFQRKCVDKMGDAGENGKTVLFVSHNMAAVKNLCNKVILLDGGVVVESGDPSTICDKYIFPEDVAATGTHSFRGGEDHTVKFIRAETLNEKGEVTSAFRADEDIRFRITYSVEKDIRGSSLAINICNFDGTNLWATSDIDVFSTLFEQREKGSWIYECVAPGNVLRPGRYLVALGAGDVTGQYFHHPDPFPIEILEQGFWKGSHKNFGISGGPLAVPMRPEKPRRADDSENN